MKRRTIFRTAFFLATLCIAVWRVPDLLDRLSGMSTSYDPKQLIGEIAGADLPVDIPGALVVHKNQERSSVASTLLLGNPDLSEEELARLEAEARALAPRPVEQVDRNR